MQASRSLKQVIASLNDTFTSIDIRAVGAKKKVATQWECIFLKVRLTSDNRSKLLEVYEKKKKDLDAKINVRFRLFVECRDIPELDSTINEIQNGLVNISFIIVFQIIKKGLDWFSITSVSKRFWNKNIFQTNR
jgi:hypothetical protein